MGQFMGPILRSRKRHGALFRSWYAVVGDSERPVPLSPTSGSMPTSGESYQADYPQLAELLCGCICLFQFGCFPTDKEDIPCSSLLPGMAGLLPAVVSYLCRGKRMACT